MKFIIKNEDLYSNTIKFRAHSPYGLVVEDSYFPDTGITHDINPGGFYIDSFLIHKISNGNCGCYTISVSKDFVGFQVLKGDSLYREISIHPECYNCAGATGNNNPEIPESTIVAYVDTIKFSTACVTLPGKVIIDSVGFASTNTLKDVDTALYDPDRDGCLWGFGYFSFYPDDTTEKIRRGNVRFGPVDTFCAPSSYFNAGFKAGAIYQCIYTGPVFPFGSLCNVHYDIPGLSVLPFIGVDIFRGN